MRNRRSFLKFVGAGVTGAGVGALGPIPEARGAMPFQARSARPAAEGATASRFTFAPIEPSDRDDLVLPAAFGYDVIASWGDQLPGTNARFGYNCDFTAFIPLPGTPREGLLWVNHEYPSWAIEDQVGVYHQTFPQVLGREPTLEDEMMDVGGTVLHLREGTDGRWHAVASPLNRRYDANSRMRASGPALQRDGDVGGTLANCSGCHTPWNTVLTCEENFQDYAPEAVDLHGQGSIGGRFGKRGSHFGWVVEIDPADPAFVPVKHTMLGRFHHENVALRSAPGERVIAYLGDDRTNGHVYRFVSEARLADDPAGNRGSLLGRGRLYAAVFHADGTGEWRELAEAAPLRPAPGTILRPRPAGATTLGQVYADLGAIVTDAHIAGNLIGATPCGRPEDVEVHPHDQSVFIAFTANATVPDNLFPNFQGEIWRLVEEGDGTGPRFTWMRWKAGGPNDPAQAGRVFAAPDNLSFDRAGNMWIVTDISSGRVNADARYTVFKNNGMFLVPTAGPDAGIARQFASAPCEAELTGPSWTPDERTLFLSVQHPGEVHGIRTPAMSSPRGSNWPSLGVGDPPRPSVVAISRR